MDNEDETARQNCESIMVGLVTNSPSHENTDTDTEWPKVHIIVIINYHDPDRFRCQL